MYVCMCMHKHICIYTYMHTYIHIYITYVLISIIHLNFYTNFIISVRQGKKKTEGLNIEKHAEMNAHLFQICLTFNVCIGIPGYFRDFLTHRAYTHIRSHSFKDKNLANKSVIETPSVFGK